MTKSTYEIYTTDAVFHDPVGIAVGVDKIRHQFNGLAQVRLSLAMYSAELYIADGAMVYIVVPSRGHPRVQGTGEPALGAEEHDPH